MARDLHVCVTFISFGVLEALLVRMHKLVFFKMILAEPVAAELWQRFSQQILTPVFCTPTWHLKMMQILYTSISTFQT